MQEVTHHQQSTRADHCSPNLHMHSSLTDSQTPLHSHSSLPAQFPPPLSLKWRFSTSSKTPHSRMTCLASSVSMISELMVNHSSLLALSHISSLPFTSRGRFFTSWSLFPDLLMRIVISYRASRKIKETTCIQCLAWHIVGNKQLHMTYTFSKIQFPHALS